MLRCMETINSCNSLLFFTRYKVTKEQMDWFLAYMEDHIKLANNSFLGKNGVATKAKCWAKITEQMNALGVARNTNSWQNVSTYIYDETK